MEILPLRPRKLLTKQETSDFALTHSFPLAETVSFYEPLFLVWGEVVTECSLAFVWLFLYKAVQIPQPQGIKIPSGSYKFLCLHDLQSGYDKMAETLSFNTTEPIILFKQVKNKSKYFVSQVHTRLSFL